jgi:hypothetical protein
VGLRVNQTAKKVQIFEKLLIKAMLPIIIIICLIQIIGNIAFISNFSKICTFFAV